MVRLNVNMQKALFLEICKNNAGVCGIEIVDLSEGRIPKGTVYAAAASLEHDGFITSELKVDPNPGQINKRCYKITLDGKEVLALYKKMITKQNNIPPIRTLMPT